MTVVEIFLMYLSPVFLTRKTGEVSVKAGLPFQTLPSLSLKLKSASEREELYVRSNIHLKSTYNIQHIPTTNTIGDIFI